MVNSDIAATNVLSWDDVISVDTTSQAFQDTGSAIVQLGININGESMGVTSNLLHPPGFYSLPVAGTMGVGSGYKTLSLVNNNEYFSLGGRDYTNQQKVGNVKPGESMVFSPAGQGIALFKADSSIAIMTKLGGSTTGGNLGLFIDEMDNIQLVTQGKSFITIDGAGGSAAIGTSAGAITIDKTGNIIANAGSGNALITGTNVILGGGTDAIVLATPFNAMVETLNAAGSTYTSALVTANPIQAAAAAVVFITALVSALQSYSLLPTAYSSSVFAS
jgi:hypothetical protein